jgi:hypothetical protein
MRRGMAIRREGLQGFQHNRESHECSSDDERPRPSQAEHPCENRITDDVVYLPTETRAWHPVRGSQGGKYDQGQGGHADNFCRCIRHACTAILLGSLMILNRSAKPVAQRQQLPEKSKLTWSMQSPRGGSRPKGWVLAPALAETASVPG